MDLEVAARLAKIEARLSEPGLSSTRRRTLKQKMRDIVMAADREITPEELRAERATDRFAIRNIRTRNAATAS